MPEARVWTTAADETIRKMRAEGEFWDAIGVKLNIPRNAVRERGRTLGAEITARVVVVEKLVSDDPNRHPLPPGHERTWGVLSKEPYPDPNKYFFPQRHAPSQSQAVAAFHV